MKRQCTTSRANSKTQRATHNSREPKLRALAEQAGLRYITIDALSIRRRRRGAGWTYSVGDKRLVRDPAILRRLTGLAVPPAYRDVRYAADPVAHLQAIGRDAAGRRQYRYHPKWDEVREARKARSIAVLAARLPRIRRAVRRHLETAAPTRDFAASAVVELVARSAIRAGREGYARERGTRGAATLLKSNVAVRGDQLSLTFLSKGGKRITKHLRGARLATAVTRLRQLPGRRLFQYRNAAGVIRPITAREVNAFLHEIAGAGVSLKDFRTMLACESALGALARMEPAHSDVGRRRQVRAAVEATAEELANTPAICRRSYVHQTVVSAFENGDLEQFAGMLQASPTRRARVLAKIVSKPVS
jgi:DNA topoisomerase-1